MRADKKFLSIILCLAMLFGTVAAGGEGFAQLLDAFVVRASADDATSGTCGNNLTWNYNNVTKTLTIKGTGDMTNYNTFYSNGSGGFVGQEKAPWNSYASSIRYIDMKSGVTSIGNSAFINCSSVASVKLPKGVTTIGSSAFRNCSSLSSFYIPKSLEWIDDYAFYGCNNLKDLYFEGTKKDVLKNPAIDPSGNDAFFDADIHYESSGIPGYSIPSGGNGNYAADPDAVSVGYKSDVIFNFDISSLNLPSSYSLVLCEGSTTENVIAKGDSAKLNYTVKKLTTDKQYLFTVVDSDGRQIPEYNNTILSYDIKIHVTTGLFDILIAFFLGLFGLSPQYECKIVY